MSTSPKNAAALNAALKPDLDMRAMLRPDCGGRKEEV
jgi:hypothetical protein